MHNDHFRLLPTCSHKKDINAIVFESENQFLTEYVYFFLLATNTLDLRLQLSYPDPNYQIC